MISLSFLQDLLVFWEEKFLAVSCLDFSKEQRSVRLVFLGEWPELLVRVSDGPGKVSN